MNEFRQAVQGQNDETLLIRGKEIPVLTTTIRQDTLRFFVDNPRVYSAVSYTHLTLPTKRIV